MGRRFSDGVVGTEARGGVATGVVDAGCRVDDGGILDVARQALQVLIGLCTVDEHRGEFFSHGSRCDGAVDEKGERALWAATGFPSVLCVQAMEFFAVVQEQKCITLLQEPRQRGNSRMGEVREAAPQWICAI